MIKVISKFDPVRSRPLVDCEDYYVNVHTRFARNLFRNQVSQLLRYTTIKALRQYDLNGRFERRPDAWRFIVTEYSEPLPEEYRNLFSRDHINCLRDIRSCVVRERVLVDRRTGQTNFAKYLFEYDRSLDMPPGQCDDYYEEMHSGRLVDLLSTATGLRLFASNKVISEAETAPLEEPGQVTTGRPLLETEKYCYEEFLFDHEEWAEEFFASAEARGILQAAFFKVAKGYLVEERTGFDRR